MHRKFCVFCSLVKVDLTGYFFVVVVYEDLKSA